ncbi:MAG TPA: hypothetical protein VKB38_19715 [Terracidiphilus sp.]|nr:hypothetical protein [Terracidiphilus sp.]
MRGKDTVEKALIESDIRAPKEDEGRPAVLAYQVRRLLGAMRLGIGDDHCIDVLVSDEV